MPSPDHPTIRCAIYTRQSVAHGRDVDFTSCAAQREACELFVRSMRWEGWEILSERFDDVGASGATLDRPALQRLLAAARQGRVDRIVVHRFDRLSRSVLNWVRLAEELRAAEVELSVMAAGSLDVGLATSGLVTNLLAFFGEFERELIRERLRDARAARAARGLRAAGRVPFGYQAHPVTHQLEPHPVEAAVVQDFFRRAAAGETAEAIAASANERGIRTKANRKQRGSCWTGRTVLQLLRSPLYIGMRGAGGEQLPGLQAALVDEQTALRAWEQSAARRTRPSTPRGLRLLPDQYPFMLKGILRCGGCGGSMTTSASQAVTVETADSVPRYYRCRGSVAYPACQPAVQVPAREVEEAVIARLRQPSSIRGAPPLIRLFLGWIDDLWERLDRRGKNVFVQAFVHGATWHPENRRVAVELDLEMIAPLAEAEAQRRQGARDPPVTPPSPSAPDRPRRRRR